MNLTKKLMPTSLFLLLVITLFYPIKSWGQANPRSPDCGPIFVQVTTTGASGAQITFPGASPWFDNRTTGCDAWAFMYAATATSGTFTSVAFQSANGATTTPGSFGAWPGEVVTGENPNTNQTRGETTFALGCTAGAACNVDNSFIRILLTRNNFVGTITGVFYGYKIDGASIGGGGAPCLGSLADPCVVAGSDGAVRIISTNAAGQGIPANGSVANVDMVSNTNAVPQGTAGATLYVRNLAYKFNGATWDRDFNCIIPVAVQITAATDVIAVPLAAATTTRLCHLSISWDVTADLTLRQGTGTTCGTNQVSLSGAYENALAVALDFRADAALRTTVAARDICLHFSTAVTGGGVAVYAQF